MGEIVNLLDFAALRGRPLKSDTRRFVPPHRETESAADIMEVMQSTSYTNGHPSTHMSALHHIGGYKSRREWFWRASELYGHNVEVIQSMAFELGVDNDFDALVAWMKGDNL